MRNKCGTRSENIKHVEDQKCLSCKSFCFFCVIKSVISEHVRGEKSEPILVIYDSFPDALYVTNLVIIDCFGPFCSTKKNCDFRYSFEAAICEKTCDFRSNGVTGLLA